MIKIVLFGAGTLGKNVHQAIRKDFAKVVAFVDNDVKKHDTYLLGIKVYAPNKLKTTDFDYIFIASMYVDEIYNQLVELGISDEKIISQNTNRNITEKILIELNDEEFLKKRFRQRVGRELNLENPIYFNDKLQWLKLNWYDPVATKCADKYEVREIIKEKIGEEYLNELLAVYDSVDEIDIDKLPDKFVLKANHSSGQNLIVADKNKVNWEDEFKNMRRWLKTNYYWSKREWVYKDIKPRIIAEKYIEDLATGKEDVYKIFYFHGKPKFLYVENDMKMLSDFYDINWNKLNVTQHYKSSKTIREKPKDIDMCFELGRKLAEAFPHARIDFYIIKGRILFSEVTFFNWSGLSKFNPEEYDELFGSYLDLTTIIDKRYTPKICKGESN
ncbi:MAG: ATP-grasp fold amidoligase family protein [Tissierellaceae bacterium]